LIIKRIAGTTLAVIIGFSLSFTCSFASGDNSNEITMVIPAKVLAECVNDMLPIEITGNKKVSGELWVKRIDALQLGLNKISFSTTIHGEDIRYTGKIGDLPASIHVKSIDTSLKCEALIRYDRENDLLYVKPKILEEGKGGELMGSVLNVLVGSKEFSVEVQRLRPIVAKFSNKTVTIDMDISNIFTANDRLFIVLRPNVKTRNTQNQR
jgi:hypothetical protein